MKKMVMLGAMLGTLSATSPPGAEEAIPLTIYQNKQFTIEAA